jgi:hypothetical protein
MQPSDTVDKSALPSVTQEKGRMFREAFLNKLSLLLRGTVAAPADRFGETLADEHMMGGEHAHPAQGLPVSMPLPVLLCHVDCALLGCL